MSSMGASRRKPQGGTGKLPPRVNKYANVQSKLDTGSSASKAEAKSEYVRSRFKYRKGELFRRIKANTLVQLMLEVADRQDDDYDFDEAELDEAATLPQTVSGAMHAPPVAAAAAQPSFHRGAANSQMSMASMRSTLLDVVTGGGELEPEVQPQRKVDTMCPYLLIDLRDKDDFAKCHIRGAHNFPHTRLSRATNSFTPDIHAYMNKEGKIIIAYDEDESHYESSATTMVQRGIDNLFVLSGGLRVMAEKFPQGVIVGELPASCRPPKARKGPGAPAVPQMGELTASNLDIVREQLETNLLNDDASSTASSFRGTSRAGRSTAGSRTTTRGPSRAASRGAASTTSTTRWR